VARHVLVTGGAGYVGSHACKALASAGYTPIAYDNLVHGHEWAVRWGPLEKGDILDKVRLDEVLGKYRPEAVMHFAAFAYVGESVGNPGKYYRNNLCGTVTLLESMRDHEVDRIVFSSSCSTYGVPQSLPIKETHPQNPVNPYGASKGMVERMLEDFDAAHGIKSVCLRYFNAAGADPDGEIGEDHDPETHLIPLVLRAALGQRPSGGLWWRLPDSGRHLRQGLRSCGGSCRRTRRRVAVPGRAGGIRQVQPRNRPRGIRPKRAGSRETGNRASNCRGRGIAKARRSAAIGCRPDPGRRDAGVAPEVSRARGADRACVGAQ